MLAIARNRPWVLGLATVLTLVLLYIVFTDDPYISSLTTRPFHASTATTSPSSPPPPPKEPSSPRGWQFDAARDERNLGLTEEQCQTAFPAQYAEIGRARKHHESRGGIHESQIALWRNESDKAHGQLRILIYDGDLYIVGEKQGVVDRTRYLNGAAMIYRAITALPDPRVLPNIEFTLDRMDHPNPPPTRPNRVAWGWTRHLSDSDTWVMPDFNGWASSGWDTVGGYRAFREKTKHTLTPFATKHPKLLWRGQLDVGQKISPIRTALVEHSKDQPWSDVRAFRWGDGSDAVVQMEDHCLWQFLAHTEGNSWSGRLRNLVNCNSAILIHQPLEWMAHFYPVLQGSGPEQNFVPVKNDWSDLRETMDHYLAHPEEAERIANRTKEVLRDRYMTPAAEACYIRRMIYEWAKVQKWEPKLFKEVKDEEGKVVGEKMRGFSWERFAWRRPKNIGIDVNDYFWKSDVVDFED